MTRWIAIFTNRPDTKDLRKKHLQAHMSYFAARSNITLSGSTTPYGQSQSNGGVWVIKGVTYEEAVNICRNDPFFEAGVRQKVSVLEYKVAPQFEEVV